MSDEQTENSLAFVTIEELVAELKRRSKTLFLAIEPIANDEFDWADAWKSEDGRPRTAIALADEAAFRIRLTNRPIDD